jgi:hypothetical protein
MTFAENAAKRDVESVCNQLTGVGRAQAVGWPRLTGRRPKPASVERCLAAEARVAIQSEDLAAAVENDWLQVRHTHVNGRRASTDLCNGARCVRHRLIRTDDGWKVDLYGWPVE